MAPTLSTRPGTAPRGRIANQLPALRRFEDWRAILAAMVVWVFSGNSVIDASPMNDMLVVAGFGAQLVLCYRPNLQLSRLGPFVVLAALYTIWTLSANLFGITGQFVGLAGQLLKIGIIATPLVFLPRPAQALVEAMFFICLWSIPIYLLRQVMLFVGFDIADLFNPVYAILAYNADKNIFFFNFDIPSEIGRNSGAFREPGMFAANVALATILLFSDAVQFGAKKLRRFLLVFFVALITARSTMGFAALPLLAMLALRKIRIGKVQDQLLPLLAIMAVAIALYTLSLSQADKVGEQLMKVDAQTGAWYNTRFGNAYVDYVAIKGAPLIGYGFAETGRPVIWEYVTSADSAGFGNGLTGTAVKFGLPFAIALMLFMLWRIRDIYPGWIMALCAWACVALLLFSQQLLTLTAVFCMFGRYPKFQLVRYVTRRKAVVRSGVGPMSGEASRPLSAG